MQPKLRRFDLFKFCQPKLLLISVQLIQKANYNPSFKKLKMGLLNVTYQYERHVNIWRLE